MKIIVFWLKISLKYVTQGPTEVKIGLAYGLANRQQAITWANVDPHLFSCDVTKLHWVKYIRY